MTAANQSIVTAYETLNMSPEQIADTEGFDILAVKAILNQCSSKYRGDTQQNKSLDFSDNQLDQANAIIEQCCLYAEDEGLRFRAAKYIRNDKKGRLDMKRDLRNMNFNITVLNGHLQQAMQAIEATRTSSGLAVLDKAQEPQTVDI